MKRAAVAGAFILLMPGMYLAIWALVDGSHVGLGATEFEWTAAQRAVLFGIGLGLSMPAMGYTAFKLAIRRARRRGIDERRSTTAAMVREH